MIKRKKQSESEEGDYNDGPNAEFQWSPWASETQRALNRDLGEVIDEYRFSLSVDLVATREIKAEEEVAEAAAAFGQEVDYEVLEAHHSRKIDAPSGTAVRLGEILAKKLSWDIESSGVYGRQGNVGARSEKEIGFSSIRGGDIVGDHTVFFIGEGERVEITHRAQSRMNFARGAIRASRFLSLKKNRLYDMEQLLEMS